MTRPAKYCFLTAFLFLLTLACSTRGGMSGKKEWINKLDSLAGIAIGPGAKCLDPVKRIYSFNGRQWIYNETWGGVLEVPIGCVPEDGGFQRSFSYHGAGMFTPDSLVYIKHYEGLQCFEFEDFVAITREDLSSRINTVLTSFRQDSLTFSNGSFTSPVIIAETLNEYGIKGYYRYIYVSPKGVEYVVSFQYPADREQDYAFIREMVDRYPFSPTRPDEMPTMD